MSAHPQRQAGAHLAARLSRPQPAAQVQQGCWAQTPAQQSRPQGAALQNLGWEQVQQPASLAPALQWQAPEWGLQHLGRHALVG